MVLNLTNSENRSAEGAAMLVLVFRMESVTIPLIVGMGLLGNIMSAIVFLQAKLRKVSCSIYLCARAISDTGFLLCLFVIWLYNMGVDVFSNEGMCKIEVFITYTCSFLSVWCVVWVSVENYFRICRPFKMSCFCTVQKARIVIGSTVLLGCAVYCVAILTTTTVDYKGKATCSGLNQYLLINTILSYLDTILTLALPSLVIILVTGRILYRLVTSCRRKPGRFQRGSGAIQTKVTRLLFFVSLIFLLLNLPSHTIRIKLLIESWIGVESRISMEPANYLQQHICQQIYYLSFSVNFFVYISLGEAFRHTCHSLLCKCMCLKKSPSEPGVQSKCHSYKRASSRPEISL